MTPPISIDGTDITGATIDGTDVTEITVDGQTVFTAGPAIVDDFESGSLSPYTNTSNFSIVNSPVIQGSKSLELTISVQNSFDMFSEPGDGLANYPEKGQKFSALLYDTDIRTPAILFGVDGASQNGYLIAHVPDRNEARVRRIDGGSQIVLFTPSASLNKSEWYEYEIQWHDGTGSEPDNTIELTIFEIDSNLNRISQISNGSAVDSTYSANRGVGYADTAGGNPGIGYVDNYVILGPVD